MTTAQRILIADGEPALRRALREQLSLFEPAATVEEAGTGAEALALARRQSYDVIVLDIALPDQDGREVCRILRQTSMRAPIIMMAGADSDDDTITGLSDGANDYVVKPFRMATLLGRVHAYLTQDPADNAVLPLGPYEFQPAAKMLTLAQGERGGARKVRLTEKETAILKYLYRTGKKCVSRETLLGEVWGYNAGVTTHTLETHVYRLRQKIETDPQNARLLITEPGGYRLDP
jgi:DNA-binding response OmpR family regulator